ncbi:hypothetical protein HMPREF0083_01461, partial [Aneurinibacillus aneurinilyticus ATCC 12856]
MVHVKRHYLKLQSIPSSLLYAMLKIPYTNKYLQSAKIGNWLLHNIVCPRSILWIPRVLIVQRKEEKATTTGHKQSLLSFFPSVCPGQAKEDGNC